MPQIPQIGSVGARPSSTGSNIDLSGLLKTLTSQYEETRAEKQGRYDEGVGILQSVVEQFGPGYLKGEEKRMLADMEQGMVGRGLGGTTRPAAAGMGIKADIRDRATKARTGAMTNVAQFMAGFQDLAPDPGTLAHLATGGFSGLLQQALASAPGGPLGPMQVGAGGGGAGSGGGGRMGGGGAGGGGGSGGGAGISGGGIPRTMSPIGPTTDWGDGGGAGASATLHFGPSHGSQGDYGNLSEIVTGKGPGGYTYGLRGGGNL